MCKNASFALKEEHILKIYLKYKYSTIVFHQFSVGVL